MIVERQAFQITDRPKQRVDRLGLHAPLRRAGEQPGLILLPGQGHRPPAAAGEGDAFDAVLLHAQEVLAPEIEELRGDLRPEIRRHGDDRVPALGAGVAATALGFLAEHHRLLDVPALLQQGHACLRRRQAEAAEVGVRGFLRIEGAGAEVLQGGQEIGDGRTVRGGLDWLPDHPALVRLLQADRFLAALERQALHLPRVERQQRLVAQAQEILFRDLAERRADNRHFAGYRQEGVIGAADRVALPDLQGPRRAG